MRFEIVTIFPAFLPGFLENGILRRALAEGLVEVGVHDLRGFTHDRHRTVDDRPFGGGEGMVLKAEPLAEALASLGIGPKAAFETCQGTTSVVPNIQKEDVGALAPEGGPLAQRPAVILLSRAGATVYPGDSARAHHSRLRGADLRALRSVDERINELYCDMEPRSGITC